jgi:hypothetical protein
VKKEIENPFGGLENDGVSNGEQFAEDRRLWDEGELSSDVFLPKVIDRLLTSYHLFRDGNTTLADLPREEVLNEMRNSLILKEAYRAGYEGGSPGEWYEDFMLYYFEKMNAKVVRERWTSDRSNPRAKINSRVFENLDDELPYSLPLHFYAAGCGEGFYKSGDEGVAFGAFEKAVFDNVSDKSQADTINHWLHYRGILNALKEYEVGSILRITEYREGRFAYGNYDELATAIAPMMYFRGWRQRLEEANGHRDYTLPDFVRSNLAKQTLLSAYFMSGTDRQEKADLLGQSLKSIEKIGSTDEIRGEFAHMQAQAILKGERRPLASWELNNLNISALVEEYVAAKDPDHPYLTRGQETEEIVEYEEVVEDVTPDVPPIKDGEVAEELPAERESEEMVSEKSGDEQGVSGREESGGEELKELGQDLTDERKGASDERETTSGPDTNYGFVFQTSKNEGELLKEDLSSITRWSSIEYKKYLYSLLEGNEALLEFAKHPFNIEADRLLYYVMNEVGNRGFTQSVRAFLGISKKTQGFTSSELLPIYTEEIRSMSFLDKRDYMMARSNMEPVVADVCPGLGYMNAAGGPEIFRLETVYDFLMDKKHLPITIIVMRDRNFLLARGSDTVHLDNVPHPDSAEAFQAKWFRAAGLRVPDNPLAELFSIDGASMLTSAQDRRDAVIKACDVHKVTVYENKKDESFTRIA